MKLNKVYIYGKHALEEALQFAPKAINKIFFDPKAVDPALRKLILSSGIAVGQLSEGQAKADMKSGASHQGVVAQILLSELVVPYEKFIEQLSVVPHTSLVLLSGVVDPHNVGAIIRTAAGFGAGGVLMPEQNQAPVSGAVIKVSAGMAFRVPLVSVTKLQQTISDLKKRGFKIYGLAGEGAKSIAGESFDTPSVFILGNEGEGIPGHLRALCDTVLSIPLNPKCESLNVAAAAAITLFAWSAKHPEALKQK
ncbi:MAG: 23S rRNA (guanosine2251-2'-O)-methyltransferase [Parcubacteria group bacterium Gr01-1014_56]|nr:MAG: 23S rRNA (guanosine2251-2'-O)-methyltransferase [Parcubacteria group bacterium Gr01-1014_56]